MRGLIQDIRICSRGLARRPLYAGVAIVTLGLGIGAATAMLGVAQTVLLPNLSYEDPDRLVTLWQEWPGYRGVGAYNNLTDDQYRLWRDNTLLFDNVAMFNASAWGEATLTGRGEPTRVGIGSATASLADVVGVAPMIGRWFLKEEEGLGNGAAAPVAVVSHGLWSRLLAADPGAIGDTVELDGVPRTVVGVLPPDFRLRWLSESPLQSPEFAAKDVWVPYGQTWDCVSCGSSMYQGVGRLSAGVTIEQAQAEAERILEGSASWVNQISVRFVPRSVDEIRGLASPLLLLLIATCVLLLIACGNVATLAAAEVQGRRAEIATRVALGASSLRIISLSLVESVILGLVGSVLGVVIAAGGVKVLGALAPPIPRIDQVAVDLPLVFIAAGLGVVAGCLFGAAPSLAFGRSPLAGLAKGSGRTKTARSDRFQATVIGLEIALAVVLLISAGLLAKSFSKLLDVNPGFDTESLATAHLSLPDDRYANEEQQNRFLDDVLRRMDSIPGAVSATAANGLPFPGRTSGWSVWKVEQPTQDDRLSTRLFHVAAGYHEAMGIPILAGRGFTDADDTDAERVAVVGESLAAGLWPNRSPIGERMHYPWGTVVIVGIAGDIKRGSLSGEQEKMFYVPFAQHARGSVSFAVRATGDAAQVIAQMREAIWAVDSNLAITDTEVMASLMANSAGDERFRTLLISFFSIAAVLLAVVGVFGVTARAVARRTRELAIRLALGADRADLTRLVVGRSLTVGLLGVAGGVVVAFWTSRWVGRFLFGVNAFDVTTYLVVCLSVLAVAVVASYIPARRSTRVDPVETLRSE